MRKRKLWSPIEIEAEARKKKRMALTKIWAKDHARMVRIAKRAQRKDGKLTAIERRALYVFEQYKAAKKPRSDVDG